MLIFDLRTIGNKLLTIRKRMGMTQAEVAEAAGLSDRTYADIERGSVNMRTETILRICNVLHITPDEVLTEESTLDRQAGGTVGAAERLQPQRQGNGLTASFRLSEIAGLRHRNPPDFHAFEAENPGDLRLL
ncbi:MAG: helix-turn-helix transcriptional regulator, partial [Lachnospiraceae bacterium]